MARTVKIVQAATDDSLFEGGHITNVLGYGTLLRDVLAPIHTRFAERLGYTFKFEVNNRDVHPFWMKAHMITEAIEEGFDRVVWLDSDAIWLGDPIDMLLPTVFGMTYHDGFGAYDSHFNAGVIYVNNRDGMARETVAHWYAERVNTFHDQNVLNANHLDQITHLGHEWNSSEWISHYSAKNPKVVAWHGCPDRIAHMMAYIDRAQLISS